MRARPIITRARDPALHRARTCRYKKRYKRQWLAEQDAHRVSGQTGGYIVAYPCRYCNGWHIGHIVRSDRDERSRVPAAGKAYAD